MNGTEQVINQTRKKIAGRTMLVFLAVMLLLTFFSNTLNNYTLPKVTCETPVNGAIVRQVTGNGTVQAKKTFELYIPVSMKVLEMKVKAGDAVKKGQLLMRLDTTDIENQLADERDRYEQKKISLQKLMSQSSEEGTASYDNAIDAAKEDMQKAERNYKTIKELFAAGGESEVDVSNALTARENSKREYENAVNSKSMSEENNLRDISSTKYDLSIAERKIEQLEQQLAYGSVTAPADGVITQLGFSEGTMAGGSIPLYKIADTSSGFQFVTTVDMDSASYLALDDTAAVTVTSLGGSTIQGRISNIADNQEHRGEKKDLYIDIPADGLLGGESGSADITKNLKTYSVLVPNSAIGEDNGAYFVYIVKSRRGPLGNENYVEKVSVTIGESDDLRTGITNGLEKGEQVVVASDKAISDSTRVMVN